MTFANFVQCQLSTPISAAALTAELRESGAPYILPPVSGGVIIIADSMNKPSVLEILRYKSRVGTTLTGLTRAMEGTVAREWTTNAYLYQSLTAASFAAAVAEPELATYSYDTSGQIIGSSETVSGQVRTSTYAYDASGNLFRATIIFAGTSRVETYSYDTSGNLTGMNAEETSV